MLGIKTKLIVLTLLLWLPALQADQNNPQIDALMQALQVTSDSAEGARITQQIWDNWTQTDDPEVQQLLLIGQAYMQRARYDEAIAYFSQIIEIAPNFSEGWNRRATAYFFNDQYEQSSEDIRQTLTLEPRHFGAIAGQGLIYMKMEKYRLAIGTFQRALEINPHLKGIKNNISLARKLLYQDAI